MGACDGGLPHDHPAGAKDRDERAFVALVDVGASVSSLCIALPLHHVQSELTSTRVGILRDHLDETDRNLGSRSHSLEVARGVLLSPMARSYRLGSSAWTGLPSGCAFVPRR